MSRLTEYSGFMRIKRTPTILQMEAIECGAASLAIVLAHHGAWVPLERLRVACGVSRDGSKASNIIKAAHRFGLSAKGYRKEPAALATMPMPCIIHWNFNHFVVLEGIRRGRAYINDPASGRRQTDLGELDLAFTGVVLSFQKTPDFVRIGGRPRMLSPLLGGLGRSKAAVALLAGISLALVVPGIVIPAFTKIFVDDILIQSKTSWLTPLLIGMGVAALFRAVVAAIQQSLLLRLQAKLAVVMVSRFLWFVLALPIEFFTQRHAGDIASRVATNEQIATLLANGIAANALNLVSVVFFAGAMAVFDAPLAAVGIGLSLLNVAVLKALSRRRTDLSRGLALEQGKLVGSTVSAVRSIETLKASGLEDDAFAQWSGIQAKSLNAEQGLGLSSALLDVLPALLTGLTTAAILGVGGLRVIEGSMTLGSLIAFQSLMASFSEPITGLVNQAGSIQTMASGFERLQDVFAYPVPAPRPAEAARDVPAKLAGRIRLEDVAFGFSPLEPPLIEQVSIAIEPGTRVALVGSSGSGKSTLGRLICGLYTPWSGRVLIDGLPIAEIPAAVFANSVAYVDQDIFLFEGTARDNLTLWDNTVTDSDLSRALRDAAIHDDIATRAGNYDCRVAEGGTNFSGGQRQRIEIARALVSNPSIVLLDEATAALDPVTETLIDDNLRRRGCTCVVIAHRLSTIRDCDEIIVLHQGRVVERGTHEDLIALGGRYAELVALQ
ncbi:NHLP family bacteriocin export ABC transporter peptidase/permease/ATPase subunit [Methylobacterium sp. J-078]|uniref:NHLP family bacteriocin export ABC transporter peptidase/permease/ATPase subunit n=1 Tax=Methylobacterium sp. J-078 TaxID=2836657 RepID=UPI0028BE04DA|nr:NHLP family bacteriocin export ABC transporter peptidase/permease/ATPase subunit [Methylobacterium sp. J-078]